MAKRSKILPLLTWRSALCDSDLPPAARHVALTMSLYMNERGAGACPGPATLAHDTGLSLRTVKEHRKLLEETGWIELTKAGGLKGERREANQYRAAIPDGFYLDGGSTRAAAAPVGPDRGDGTGSPAESCTREADARVQDSTRADPARVPVQETASTGAAAAPKLSDSPEEKTSSSRDRSTDTSPSSSSTADDEDEASRDRDQRLVEVWPALARLKLSLRRAPEPVSHRANWLAEVARNDELVLGDLAVEILYALPDISVDDLAGRLLAGPDACPVCLDDFVIDTGTGYSPCPRCNPTGARTPGAVV